MTPDIDDATGMVIANFAGENEPGSVGAAVAEDPSYVADNGSPFNTNLRDSNVNGSVSWLGGINEFLTDATNVIQTARDAGIIRPAAPAGTATGAPSGAVTTQGQVSSTIVRDIAIGVAVALLVGVLVKKLG